MDLNVEEYGTGQPIIFIHGAGGSTHYWYYQKIHFKDLMRVILVDLPGHGQSPGDACETVEEARDAVREIVVNRGIGRPYIAGHSMGGAIAMSFALTYPDLLKGLVLVCTGAKLRTLPAILEGVLKDKEATVRMIMMDYAFSRKAPQKVKDNGFRDMMKSSAESIYRDFAACNSFNAIGSLDKITCPTLIIVGKDDLLTPPSYSEYLNREIKGSSLDLIDDAGHMVMIEQPSAVNRSIQAFVERQ